MTILSVPKIESYSIKLDRQFGGRNRKAHSEADRLDPLSTPVKLMVVEGKRTGTRNIICYSLRGVMEICRFNCNHLSSGSSDSRFGNLVSEASCHVFDPYR